MRRYRPSAAGPWAIAGATVGLGAGFFISTLLTGEIVADPGGWTAVVLIAALLGPMGVLMASVFVRPRVGSTVMTVLGILYFVVSMVGLVFAEWLLEFENTHGPILLAVGLIVWVPIVGLGLFQPLRAGLLLLLTVALPALADIVAMFIVDRPAIAVSFVALGLPFVIAGVLFVIQAWRAPTRDRTKVGAA